MCRAYPEEEETRLGSPMLPCGYCTCKQEGTRVGDTDQGGITVETPGKGFGTYQEDGTP